MRGRLGHLKPRASGPGAGSSVRGAGWGPPPIAACGPAAFLATTGAGQGPGSSLGVGCRPPARCQDCRVGFCSCSPSPGTPACGKSHPGARSRSASTEGGCGSRLGRVCRWPRLVWLPACSASAKVRGVLDGAVGGRSLWGLRLEAGGGRRGCPQTGLLGTSGGRAHGVSLTVLRHLGLSSLRSLASRSRCACGLSAPSMHCCRAVAQLSMGPALAVSDRKRHGGVRASGGPAWRLLQLCWSRCHFVPGRGVCRLLCP